MIEDFAISRKVLEKNCEIPVALSWIQCGALSGLLVAGFVRSRRREMPTTMFFKKKFGGPIKRDRRALQYICRRHVGYFVLPCRTTMQCMGHNIMAPRWVATCYNELLDVKLTCPDL